MPCACNLYLIASLVLGHIILVLINEADNGGSESLPIFLSIQEEGATNQVVRSRDDQQRCPIFCEIGVVIFNWLPIFLVG